VGTIYLSLFEQAKATLRKELSRCPTDRAGPPPAGLTMMNGWLIVKRCPKDRSVAVGPAGQELRERASRVPDTPE
jgi:hypothetical protein